MYYESLNESFIFLFFIFFLLNLNYTDLNIQIVDKLTIKMNKQARYTCNIRRSLSHEARQRFT